MIRHRGHLEHRVVSFSLAKNPVISFRLKKEEKEKLEEIVKDTNTSVSKCVSDFVRAEKEEEKIKLLGENEKLESTIEELRKKIGTLSSKITRHVRSIKSAIICEICGSFCYRPARSMRTVRDPLILEQVHPKASPCEQKQIHESQPSYNYGWL